MSTRPYTHSRAAALRVAGADRRSSSRLYRLAYRRNHSPAHGSQHGAGEGTALLQGIGTCGECGRRLATHYTGRTSSPGYHCKGKELVEERRALCLYVGAVQIDREVSRAVPEAIQPAGMEAALTRSSGSKRTTITRSSVRPPHSVGFAAGSDVFHGFSHSHLTEFSDVFDGESTRIWRTPARQAILSFKVVSVPPFTGDGDVRRT